MQMFTYRNPCAIIRLNLPQRRNIMNATRDYSQVTEVWWLKAQISYWLNRRMWNQFVTEQQIQANVAAVKARLAQLEEA